MISSKRVRKTILLISICCFCGLLCAEFLAAEEAPAKIEPSQSAVKISDKSSYIIGLADRLEVQVWKEESLSRMVTVRIDGRISLPLVGDVDAAGRSLEGLTEVLKEKLSKVVSEPAVTVILIESRGQRYYVVGKINQPGEFTIDFPLTILQAIARSGGFLEWAERDDVVVVRRENGKETFLRFDYDAFIKGKNPGQNILIKPGDTILVP
ncbi:MAG: polysaccharide export protein [Proteobacteria bacterium]|nr:polysaccharide export protein [Pseudomonadota bacterium]MBU1708967.1 polysaccharide export protein [Pseudomonadota bacterium]